MAVILLAASALLGRTGAAYVAQANEREARICIVLDAGHGLWDPGKIGVGGSLEKEINLQITMKLKSLLENGDFQVVLTREQDGELTDGSKSDTKAGDMKNRCRIIEEADPIFTVSIHQNSYTTADVKGAQVFYYGQSKEGAELAAHIQRSLVSRVDPKNHRVEKANESYYLLKKTSSPTIIVECGFMSNPREEELLNQEEYQEKLAWAIYMGICTYLSENAEK